MSPLMLHPKNFGKGKLPVRRIMVTGGRGFQDKDLMMEILGVWREPAYRRTPVTIVHGGASGADMVAHQCAKILGYEVEVHPAQWSLYGRKAGPIRNREMCEANIDLVYAFPGGRGTANCVKEARRLGIKVIEIAGGEDD